MQTPMRDRHLGDIEWCDERGAFRLKQIIEAYWADRGRKVSVRLERAPFSAALRYARVDIRSDMVDGWPRSPSR